MGNPHHITVRLKQSQTMNKNTVHAKAARYLKVVEWSDEDECFIGRIPGLIAGGVHGSDEAKVYAELCQVAEEVVELLEKDGMPLPEPTAGKHYSGKLNLRMDPSVHEQAAVRAAFRNQSLNDYIVEAITSQITQGVGASPKPGVPSAHSKIVNLQTGKRRSRGNSARTPASAAMEKLMVAE